jgi:RNA polymerase sigma factor (TIGR02999 family)
MSSTITQLLQEWTSGDEQALERLVPLVYDHLRSIATRQLSQESDITIQATELVHEAFLRLQKNHEQEFHSRTHFYGAAAEAMRRILVDLARRKAAAKRGARPIRVGLRDGHSTVSLEMDLDLLERAMEKLRKLDARQAQVVHFRFYGGLSNGEIAELMQISDPL